MFQTTDGVRVWGDPVDERAVAQAVRCLTSHDEAVAAVLMADHHVGCASVLAPDHAVTHPSSLRGP